MTALLGHLRLWLEKLRAERPVFHSEADFQHALAWTAHHSHPGLRVRLETRPAPGIRLDVLLSDTATNTHLAVELKHLTAAWQGQYAGESFHLLNQGAQDIRSYDVVKDIQRVEQFAGHASGWAGAVLVLSNDPSYWSAPSHGRQTNAAAFRLYEGTTLDGVRNWGPATGAGTMRGRETPLQLRYRHTCRWTDYSSLPGIGGRFRLLALTVPATPPG